MESQKQIQRLEEIPILQSSQMESADEPRRADPVNEPMADEAVVEQITSQTQREEQPNASRQPDAEKATSPVESSESSIEDTQKIK